MPIQPSPPYNSTSEPRQLNRWLDVNAQNGALRRTSSYITLPAFSVANSWNGYSDIIASFNFEGPNNFSLLAYDAPVSPNYLLCIMWHDSFGITHRYKLWENVGEVVYFNIPLYTGQLIKKNFRFEVWSTNTTPLVNTTAFNFYTSVLGTVDYRYGTDFTLVSSDTMVTNFADVISVPAVITQGLLLWYRPDFIVGGNWISGESSGNILTFTGAPSVLTDATVLNNKPFIDFSACSCTGGFPNTPDPSTLITLIVMSKKSAGSPSDIFDYSNSGSGVQKLVTSNADFGSFNIDSTPSLPTQQTKTKQFSVLNLQQGITLNDSLVPFVYYSSLSSSDGGDLITNLTVHQSPMYIAEILIFDKTLINIYQVALYFAQRYSSSSVYPLPLTFPANSTSTTN